jgi:hypothetical protein
MARFELVVTAVLATLALDGCASTSGAGPTNDPRPAAGGGALAAQPMMYGGGDGSSCAQAVVVHARSEMAGVRAEYAWIAARYPGYQRGGQSLIQCNDRPADQLRIRTASGQEVDIFFDISEYFGQL